MTSIAFSLRAPTGGIRIQRASTGEPTSTAAEISNVRSTPIWLAM